MLVSFDQLFSIQNGMISPRVPVSINGVTMGPGVSFGGGVAVGRTFDVDVVGGVYVLKSAY